ncbi:hypothetical protein D3C73_1325770 [compost metagenome]
MLNAAGGSVLGGALRDNRYRLSQKPAGIGQLHVLGQVDQLLDALILDVLVHLILHPGGRRAGTLRIREYMHFGIADLLHEVVACPEHLVGLTREADDEVGRDRHIRHRLADTFHFGQILFSRILPAHPL